MENTELLERLEASYKKCSDCGIHPEHQADLDTLLHALLTPELVAFLCEQIQSKKHFWEMRLEYLKILLLNQSARQYDLKAYFYAAFNRSRRPAFKLFLLRGYALYATEAELEAITKKFMSYLLNYLDYIDYECILSVAGLPYLVETYGYPCFVEALTIAQTQYEKISPLLRGFFTMDEHLAFIHLLPAEEVRRRTELFLAERRYS